MPWEFESVSKEVSQGAVDIKKEFDKKYNPTWHVIVGRNFGENERNAPLNFTTSCLTISIFPLQAHM